VSEPAVTSLGLEDAFFNALTHGRKSAGLTLERVALFTGASRSGNRYWAAIAKSTFFSTLAGTEDSVSETILRYIVNVTKRLSEADRWVVDTVLALNLEKGRTYAPALGDREKEAVERIAARDDSLPGLDFLPTSQTVFRERLEVPALQRFATLLNRPTSQDVLDFGIDQYTITELLGDSPRLLSRRPARVLVVGGSVMDLMFRIPAMPQPDMPVQARDFCRDPGGKALTAAVACARLGMDTKLVSIVGDDPWGQEILKYLDEANVDRSSVLQPQGSRTAATAVMTPDTGNSLYVGWMNRAELQIPVGTLESALRPEVLARYDYLIVTFELPVESTVAALAEARRSKIVTLVVPSPPYDDRMFDPKYLDHIDFLVATPFELLRLESFGRQIRTASGIGDLQAAASALLVGGIGNVLLLYSRQCHGFVRPSDEQGTGDSGWTKFIASSWPGDPHESAGERDAFCAMFLHELYQSEHWSGTSIEAAAQTATAAMARAGYHLGGARSMPSLKEVQEFVRNAAGAFPDQFGTGMDQQ
jgi:ribokinase